MKPSQGTPATARARKASKARKATQSAAPRAAMPRWIEPELATLVSTTPEGDDFIHELKFDGYRVIARVDAGQVTLLTRRGEDWTSRMPSLQAALAS